MRRVRRWARGARLPLYKWIIGRYAAYALVRCARFTGSRHEAQQMAVYTLITTCLLAHKLRHAGQLAFLVDTMADVIGPDIVLGGPATDPQHHEEEPLIADQQMRELVDALNSLPRLARETLVLRYLGGTEVSDSPGLTRRPVPGISARVSQAESQLAERLAGLRTGRGHAGRTDARLILAQFAAALDAVWLQEIRDCALRYLIRHSAQRPRPHGCWYWN